MKEMYGKHELGLSGNTLFAKCYQHSGNTKIGKSGQVYYVAFAFFNLKIIIISISIISNSNFLFVFNVSSYNQFVRLFMCRLQTRPYL